MRLAAGAAVVLGIAAAAAPLATSDPPPLPHGNGAIAYECPGGGICVINVDGSGETQVSSVGARPRWSPDGTQLTFENGGDIYVMNADGTNLLKVASDGDLPMNAGDHDPSFSADGTRILFDVGGTAIKKVPTTGGAEDNVPSGTGFAFDPVQSPDGTKLAVGNGSGISVISEGTRTDVGTGTLGGSPAWAPDGSAIYFEADNTNHWEIDKVSPGGGDQTMVLSGDKENVGVSPDGSKLVFAYLGQGIGIAKADGTSVSVVPNAGIGSFGPAWQPVATTYSPTLTTQVSSAQAAVGTTISDSATLAGAGPSAGGSITFEAFSTASCTGSPAHSETVPVDGSGTYSAAGFIPSEAGQYTWTVTYTGNAPTDTFGATEGCGGANETTEVASASSGLVPNGSFESPIATNKTTFDTFGPHSNPTPASFGWTVTGDSIDLIRGYWSAADGSQSIDLDGTRPGGVSQTIATTAGQSYLLTFAYSANPDRLTSSSCTTTAGGASMTVAWGGTQVATYSFSSQNSKASMGWTSATLAVTAGSGPTTLAFSSTDAASACGIALDAVSLTPTESNTTWVQAQPITLTNDGLGHDAGSASGSLDSSGQASWYKFAVAPGENLDVDLTNLPANYDLTLFSDIGQAFNTLNSTSDLQQLSAEFAPSAFSPSAFSPSAFSPSAFSPSAWSPSAFSPSAFSPSAWSPSAFSPSAFSPSAFSPSAWSSFTDTNGSYESAQAISAIAISSADGTADEHIVANSWNNTGSFYIRVSGRNGTYDPGVPFTVSASEDINSCSSLQTHASDTLLTPAVDATAKTLILADYKRMPQGQALTSMQQKLQAFAGQVGGAIVDVGSQSPQADALISQAQSNPGCVYAENLAAEAVRGIVSLYRNAPNSALKYIVVVGDDHDIPFFRYPDASGLGTESNYVPPVADNTPSQASLRLNYVLSQDAYGARTILHLNGLDLPVPDLPVGRLVETPDEISGMLDAFTSAYNNTSHIASVTPSSSLVTGYDFLAGAANEVQTDFSAKFNGSADSLIAAQGTPTNQAWTADDLRTHLLGSSHGLIFLAGHFSANNTLAADFATTMNSTEISASTTGFENSIVFSAGCHSGYNIANEDQIQGVTQPLDWVEAFAQKQATVVAGTGYQYGDTDFVAYSAKLYASFAHNLVAGSVGVGAALVDAKQQYLDGTTELSGIDVKSLLEATLYGLPMLDVTMPGVTPLSAAVHASAATTVSPTPAPSGTPGGGLGLSSADESFATGSPAFLEQTKTLTDAQNHPVATATYITGPDGVVTAPGEPTLPLLSTDVTVTGQVLRGVGFLGGSFNDEGGKIPLTGDPGTDQNGTHAPFASSTFFPEKPWTVNYFPGLANQSTATQLLLTPAQYKTDAPGTDLQRQFTSLGLRLFYSSNIDSPALAAPPSISRVDASSDANGVAFKVQVVGDPSAGIQDVWVTWRPLSGNGSNEWTSLDLAQGKDDPTSWTGSLPAGTGPIEFMVQAVNGVGLVTLDDNAGAFYQPNQIAAALQTTAPTLAGTTLTLDPATPAGAPYGSTVSLTATLAPTGGGSVPNGETVTFTIGNATLMGTTTNGSASVSLPLSLADLPGSYQVKAAFAGDSTYSGSSASQPFSISALPSTLALSGGGTIIDGASTGIQAKLTATSDGTPLPQRTVEFVLTQGNTSVIQTRITDPSGIAALGIVPQVLSGTPAASKTYTVSAFFGPGGPTPPTLPPDAIYANATASTTSLTVNPVAATVTQVPPNPTNAASVSWTVAFTGPVSTPTSANFAFPGISGAAFKSVVAGTGNSYTVSATTGTADGKLGLTLTGVTDSLGGPVAGLVNQMPFTVVKTPPSIVFTASKGAFGVGAYGLLDQITISCTAKPGSSLVQIATNPCTAPVVNNEPAWMYPPGKTTVPAAPGLVAIDQAGNRNSPGATTSFTVTATTATLCTLTNQFTQGSAKFAALGAIQKKIVVALDSTLCTALSAIVPKLSASQKAALVKAYTKGVQSLVSQGWLTSAQAAILTSYASTI